MNILINIVALKFGWLAYPSGTVPRWLQSTTKGGRKLRCVLS